MWSVLKGVSVRDSSRIVLSLVGALLILLFAPFIGSMPLNPLVAIFGIEAGGGSDVQIFWQLRVPRVLLAFLIGAALAVSGGVYQALFRNFLATPFTLGVSSGASLGAAIYFHFGVALGLGGLSGRIAFGFAGALLSIFLVWKLGSLARVGGEAGLLLAGIVISFFFSSLVVFLQYLSDFNEVFRIQRWLMGRLETVGYGEVLLILPITIVGFIISFWQASELNLMTAGEEFASSRGVNVVKTRLILFLAASLMVGAAVTLCGIIGFVGIIVPYIVRLWTGPDHRSFIPVSFLLGGAFLVACDTMARTLMAPTELPVGILTALLGGPFFLWLLCRRGWGGATVT